MLTHHRPSLGHLGGRRWSPIVRWAAAVTIIVLVAAGAAALLTRGRTEQAAQPAVPAVESWSPGGHITGSVYDGGAYGTLPAESWSPGGHVTGSVYDGGAYGTLPAMTNPPLGIQAPDVQSVESLPRGLTDYIRPEPSVAAAMTNPPLGIQAPDVQNVESLPRGLTDYIRR